MRILKLGAGFAVVGCAVAAMAASAAAAGPPEWGRCTLSPTHSGGWSNAHCTIKNGKHAGAYEWEAEPGPKAGFSGIGEEPALETVGGHKITCSAATEEGTYTGGKTESTKLVLIGCETKTSGGASVGCRSNPAKEGEIESNELEGELGFITFQGKKAVALDLKPKTGSTVATYTCGTPPTLIAGTVEGSVLGRVTPINGAVEEIKVSYKTVGVGKQQIEAFEGGAKDVLTTKLVEGIELPKEEQTALRMKYVQTNEEPVEVATHA
jgi:hypothetical protein